MAPEVTVPMNFGRRLLNSPTHNTLKLNSSDGGEVFASSVIMSFNSPVIDHMTTTLHMTSVDMLEFSEAAVQMFVDAAYSGTVLGLNREIFRDVNKMANVFEMTWLAEQCAEYFAVLASTVETASISELFDLFEEAAYVMENLNKDNLFEALVEKIEFLGCQEQLLKKYLDGEDTDSLSIKRLDMIIKLAGKEYSWVIVESLTNHLSRSLETKSSAGGISKQSKYLLDSLEWNICWQSHKSIKF